MRSALLTVAAVALLFSAAAEARFPSKTYIKDYNRDKQSALAGAEYSPAGIKPTQMAMRGIAHQQRLNMLVTYSLRSDLDSTAVANAVTEISASHHATACEFLAVMNKRYNDVKEVGYKITLSQEGGAVVYDENRACKK